METKEKIDYTVSLCGIVVLTPGGDVVPIGAK